MRASLQTLFSFQLPSLLVGFILLVTSGCANQSLKNDKNLAKTLMSESGLVIALDGIPDSIMSSADEPNKEIPPKVQEQITETLMKSFRPEKLKLAMEKAINKDLTRDEQIELIKWYRSSFGRKVVRMENKANSDDTSKEIEAYVTHIGEKGVNPQRVVLAQEIIVYSGSLDTMTQVMASVTIGMIYGLNDTLPEKEKLDRKELDRRVAYLKMALRQSLAKSAVLATMYAYKDLDLEEQRRYVKFLKSKTGQKFTKTVSTSLNTSLQQAAIESGRDISRGIASIPQEI